jgi:hypothetical protein
VGGGGGGGEREGGGGALKRVELFCKVLSTTE